MPIATQNNDIAFSSALPVQKPGQQFGSVTLLPPYQSSTQLAVINAARQQVQKGNAFDPRAVTNPLYTPNGVTNGYQESKYQASGRPIPGPVGSAATSRSSIQGYPFVSLTAPDVFGGSISDHVPPPPADTYSR